MVGPGVYFLRKGDRWAKFKSRGIDARAFKVEDFQALWEAEGRTGSLPIPQDRFVGLGTALHRINGMEPPGARMWRKFVSLPAQRSLSLVPRRRWLTDDRWDGRSLAPTPKLIRETEMSDQMVRMRLRHSLKNTEDPEARLQLYWKLSGMTDSESGDAKGLFLDSDQPWN